MGGGPEDRGAGACGPVPIMSDSDDAYPTLAPKPVGQWIPNIYVGRIAQFTSRGQWEKRNLVAMLDEGIAEGEPHVKLSCWSAPGQDRPTFDEATSHEFKPAKVGEVFGPAWSTHWFKLELSVPEELRKKKHLELHWDANNEGLVWSQDGKPLQGLTGNDERIEWILPDSFRDGKTHVVYVEMACNGMFGCAPGGDIIQAPDPDKTFQLTRAQIVAVNLQARGLFIDMQIIGDAARQLPRDSWEQHRALKVATDIIDTFRVGDQESLDKCREIAHSFLGSAIDSDAVYKPDRPEAQVFGIGHCHIDSCWLWPWAETKRKVARSWTNQCNLMERYPELNFACSQAQQYKWLEEGYPHAFGRVRDQVKAGRFHPIGGSWVEHDTNMPSGESLVRQFLYGQRYFESRFGARCKTFWLPDTFGYAAQLPQICRLAGMDRFLTQKLSWNNINKFPHTTFNWVALDGSQVICHMPPSETYTAEANLRDVTRSITLHKSMDHDHTSLLVFGKGDGGGGPTWQHLEKLRRCRGVADEVGGIPRLQLGGSVDDFFDRLKPKASTFATWYGELYFELHRGTYTTQANNKRNNRRAESLLRDVELLATIASIKDKSYKYPKSDIDSMWEAVLLCQFHDCLPGSSIEMCYDDSDVLYAKVFETGRKLLDDVHKVFGLESESAKSVGDAVVVNTLPWLRREFVQVGKDKVGLAQGQGPLIQVHPYDPKAMDARPVTVKEVTKGVFVLQNSQLKLRVENGAITSLYDSSQGRELVEKGTKANQYVIYDDKPLYWQAWDVEVYHLDTRQELASTETRIGEDLGHRASIVTETRISEHSWIKTTISLDAALEGRQSRVDVAAEVEWRETMRFLKVEFPFDVRSTDAAYETAFGVVRRPTHYNTTWDMAKFEVCCHRFADLSEHGYGVSILNDSKYGFATCGNVMRLSLLRSPKAPDANADMGRHAIRWAIFPHTGALGPTTVRAALEFNNPLSAVSVSEQSKTTASLLSSPQVTLVGDEALVLDTVKRAEDDADVSVGLLPAKRQGSRSVIVRIYDSLGGRGRGTVRTGWKLKRVVKTNLLEDDLEDVKVDDDGDADGRKSFDVSLRPFEVATYRLELEE
jgi:alpha-mannosidase